MSFWLEEYMESPRIVYGDGMQFIRVCPTCGRFVKADEVTYSNEMGEYKENATCKRHGRVKMPLEGVF